MVVVVGDVDVLLKLTMKFKINDKFVVVLLLERLHRKGRKKTDNQTRTSYSTRLMGVVCSSSVGWQLKSLR